jgi:hypothetical protein
MPRRRDRPAGKGSRRPLTVSMSAGGETMDARAGRARGRRAAAEARSRRLRAPLLLGVWVLLAIDAAGGIVIFFARTAFGSLPGTTLHVIAGLALTAAYGIYQLRHAARVWPVRPRLDYALGLLAAAFFALTLVTGFVLALPWWRGRGTHVAIAYPTTAMALHIIGCMLVLTFVGSHLGAVLQRDRS